MVANQRKEHFSKRILQIKHFRTKLSTFYNPYNTIYIKNSDSYFIYFVFIYISIWYSIKFLIIK